MLMMGEEIANKEENSKDIYHLLSFPQSRGKSNPQVAFDIWFCLSDDKQK